jgi:hypothetical protein
VTKRQIEAALNALLKATNAEVPVEPLTVPASSAPAWLTQAQVVKAKGRRIAEDGAKRTAAKAGATFVVRPSTYNAPNGTQHHGFSIVKMFGDQPAFNRPGGKFITAAEFDAIRNYRG